MLTTDQKGNIAEQAVALAATRLGLDVYRPVGEGGRYDLIIDTGPRLLRVQCKWARRREEFVLLRLRSNRRTAAGLTSRCYTPEEIDAFAVYCPDVEQCYLIPMERVGDRRQIHLRLSEARNGQRGAVEWARDFEFSTVDWSTLGAVAQMARAFGWQPKGRGFESPQLHCSEYDSTASETVGANEFRKRFGYYLDRVIRGGEILVTRRGKPYVRVSPP